MPTPFPTLHFLVPDAPAVAPDGFTRLRHVITGALSKKDKDAVYTEREIRALVEAYLNTPVTRG